jgi:hypothetical protein
MARARSERSAQGAASSSLDRGRTIPQREETGKGDHRGEWAGASEAEGRRPSAKSDPRQTGAGSADQIRDG